MLRSAFEYPIRTADKGWSWQDPVDDLFDSLINPDAFYQHSIDLAQRFTPSGREFFSNEPLASASGSDSVDTAALRSLDSETSSLWQRPCALFGEARLSPLLKAQQDPTTTKRSIAPAPHSRTVSCHQDIISLELALAKHLQSLSRSTFEPVNRPSTPLSIQPRRTGTPALLKTPADEWNLPGRQPSPLSSEDLSGSTEFSRLMQDCRATKYHEHIEPGMPSSSPTDHMLTSPITIATRTAPTTESGFLPNEHSTSGRSSSHRAPHADDVDPSPFFGTYFAIPHHNTPIASPSIDSFEQATHETGNHSDFPTTPVQSEPQALLTPPTTGQMPSSAWSSPGFRHDYVVAGSASSAVGGDESVSCGGKAEAWPWSQLAAGQSGAGAAATTNALAGLGIYGSGGNVGSSGLMTPMQHHGRQHAELVSFAMPAYSAPSHSTSGIAPSLILNGPMYSPGAVSPEEDYLASPSFAVSASGQSLPIEYFQQLQLDQEQYQSNHYQHHHHQPHRATTMPAAANLSVQMPQPQPPSRHMTRTPSCTPPEAVSRKHKRSKSSQHVRRKSSSSGICSREARRTASADFVNFTSNNSKEILNGVAPSGSSKTKARREKEAADRRRKLSEAAKRAVLQAGGDLEALEREELLVMSDGL